MHHDLQHLMEKFKEMVKRIVTSSTIDHLLNSIDFWYNMEIMVVPLLLKFKVPQIKMYNGSTDPIEHLETFKTHMLLHRFLR